MVGGACFEAGKSKSMAKINVAVLTDGFIKWGGGIEFIRICLAGLSQKSGSEYNIFILIPEDTLATKLKYLLGPYKGLIVGLLQAKLDKDRAVQMFKDVARFFLMLGRRFLYKGQRGDSGLFHREKLIEAFISVCPSAVPVFYPKSRRGLLNCLAAIHASVVLPVGHSLGKNYPYPWVGYLYDFQHKYYPEFFDADSIARRDFDFCKMIEDSSVLVVNAKTVAADVEKYYPAHKSRVVVLPFCPQVNPECLLHPINVAVKYRLPKKYFIISNQFWIHKAHFVAFEALSMLHSRLGKTDVSIVCTGVTNDHRSPDYFPKLKKDISRLGLSDNILFLGYIPKRDQISVMRQAVAVIQPTLFEGGPGGGSVYDAVAYCVPAIVSDIPVNQELDSKLVVFFKTNSPSDLMEKMAAELETVRETTSIKTAIENSETAAVKMGGSLSEAIAFALRYHSVNK